MVSSSSEGVSLDYLAAANFSLAIHLEMSSDYQSFNIQTVSMLKHT
jgi:hypothetical protein